MNRLSSTAHTLTTVSPALERLARLGFASKGVVYILIGWLAAQTALGTGGQTTGSEGALTTLLEKPFGRLMLGIIALGLLGYAVWRIVEAVSDPKGRGTDGKGIGLRIASAAKGLAYGALAFSAARLAMHQSSKTSGDNAEAQSMTSTLLDKPFGRFLVIAAGLFLLGYGIYQCINAWKAKLSEDLQLGSIDASKRGALIYMSRFGIAARGVVFIVLGYFLTRAGLAEKSSEAKGLGGALDSLAASGWYWLALIAAGLIAYGLYELLNSRYRRIRVA